MARTFSKSMSDGYAVAPEHSVEFETHGKNKNEKRGERGFHQERLERLGAPPRQHGVPHVHYAGSVCQARGHSGEPEAVLHLQAVPERHGGPG